MLVDSFADNFTEVRRGVQTNFTWVPRYNPKYCEWFGADFKYLVGFDTSMCGSKFANNRLYAERTLGERRVGILLLRLEDSKTWAATLPEFFPGFHLGRKANTESSTVYDNFKKQWVWEDWDISHMLDCDSWRFYTEFERAEVLRKLNRP